MKRKPENWTDSCPRQPLVKSRCLSDERRKWRGEALPEWKIICPCQRSRRPWHRRIGHARQAGAAWLRRRSIPLVAITSIGFAAVGLPLDAGIPAFERALSSLVTKARSVELQPSVEAADVVPPEESVETELKLITKEIQEHFLDPEHEQQLRMDVVKESFFRARIPYGSIIYREARKNGLDPELVAAVVKTESDFRPKLISGKNAHGLMQIIPSTGELMGATDLMNPDDNIRVGTRYLRYLTERFGGNETLILAAYNAGEGNIGRYGGVPPFRETRNYLARVSRSNAEYEQRIAHSVRRWSRLMLPRE